MDARIRIISCFTAALGAAVFTAQSADATPYAAPRQMIDGCEVGGGGNDIHSIDTRFDKPGNQLVVTLRMCAAAATDATYRVRIDHAAPFVGEAAATPDACADRADTVVKRGPNGHKGVGRSVVNGTRVHFFIPLADLGVDPEGDVATIPLWATSTAGPVVDRAPNKEHGDGCHHPASRSETLVQTLTVFGKLVWVTTTPFEGIIINWAAANQTCQLEAASAGVSGVFGAWITDDTVYPAIAFAPGTTGPFQTADGKTVATSIADLGNCTKGPSGADCLLSPIDLDIHGTALPAGTATWTNVLPNGQQAGGPDCNDWTTLSPAESGNGGSVGEVGPGWTTGTIKACNQIHRLICFQLVGNG